MSETSIKAFVPAEMPANERARKQALDALLVLDTRPEATYDDLVALAAEACDTSIALVSLIDSERQWFKARCGLDVDETPRELSFCAHSILQPGILEVPDTLADPRFATHPAVTGEPHIRFYAGAPLIGEQGYAYGTLCVADSRPRHLSDSQRLNLERLARQVVTHLEARKGRALADASQQALAIEKARLEAVVNASVDVAIIATDPQGTLTLFNPGAEALLGYASADVVGLATPLIFHLPEEIEAENKRLEAVLGRPPSGFQDFVAEPREGRPRTRTWTFVRKDGSHRQVRLSVTAVRAPDGEVTGYLGMAVDLTEQLAAEAKAQLAADRFSGAFGAAAQGMALVALDGRWIDANEALCEMLGYARDQLLATDFQSLTHPDDLGVDLQLVEDILSGTRATYTLGKRYFHKNGRVVWTRLAVSLVRSAEGVPLHFVSQIQDVTEQRSAEERLRESEARVRSILDNSHDAFVAIDESGLIVEWNHSAEATFGWRRSEAIGKSMAELIIPERLRGAHNSGMQRFLRSGERHVLDQRIQLPAIRRSGQEFTVELTISEIHSSGRRLFCAFMQDITQRVASEERLRASEARLRLVTDNLPVCISYVGANLRFDFANQAHEAWLGSSPEWIQGRHLSEVLGAERFAEIEQAVASVLAGRTVELERDFDLPGGGIRHAQGMYIPDHRDGQVHGFYAMWHDVTAHRRLAQVLEQRALMDELTGLPNRAAWNQHLLHATAHAERAGTGLAVLFMDLDGFKRVNDNHGHDAGDAVLREFAEVLKRSFRRNDFVARLGGDEFVVLLDQVSDAERDVPGIARKIHDAVAGGMMFEGTTLPMQPSIGAAIQIAGALNAETILRCADEAMYEAKRAQGARFVLVHC